MPSPTPILAKHFDRIGLGANPFPVTPDATRYFLSKKMEVYLTELMHCIDARKGFMLVTADIGLGKTTLTRRLISLLEAQEMHVSLVFNSFLHGVELLEAINRDLGVVVQGGIGEQLSALNEFLLTQFKQQQNVIIIVDDAQNLSIESLELLRQISNLETNEHKLVQILLVAQPEIMATLSYPEIRQLKSRIALNIELSPYSRMETDAYVKYRLTSVVNSQNIHLSRSALRQLQADSGGYPRQINLIMDRVLYGVSTQRKSRISGKLIKQAVKDINRIQNDKPSLFNFSTYGFALLFLLVFLASWNYLSPLSFPSTLVFATETSHIGIVNSPRLAAESHAPIITKQKSEISIAPESESRIQLKQFLAKQQLSMFTEQLFIAIEQQNFMSVEDRLASNGWSLLHFPTQVSADSLKISTAQGQDEWLVLWPFPSSEKLQFWF